MIKLLNPNNNSDRLYYGDILSAEDYQLDFAIGTTYSLDLDALMGISISLGLSDDIDSDLASDKRYLLKALRSISDKVALFCENGQIKVPAKNTSLYILLENMVFQVIKTSALDKKKYASFHPKFWLLRYVNEKDILYKIVVLSRNLTFDRSWDISFTMDGHKKDKITNKNYAIIDFIDYLTNYSTDNLKTNKMKEMMDELKYVEFDLDSPDFMDYDFYVNGIGQNQIIQNSRLFDKNGLNNLMIVTPFLSKNVISEFNKRLNSTSQALLFTRLNSVVPLKQEDCSNFEVYTLINEIIDGASFSEDVPEINKQDIHAKIYVIETENCTELYLGSLNASWNALNNNVEFMIKLQANKNKVNISKLAEDLFNGEKDGSNCPFQLINVEDYNDEDESETDSLEKILKEISRSNCRAKIIQNDDFYNIELTFKDFDEKELEGFNISIKPLLSNNKQVFSSKILFEKLNILKLSEFFVINVDNKLSRVIKIPTDGMPEERQNEIIADVIQNKEDFMDYVSFLFGDEVKFSADNSFLKNESNGFTVQLPELYEKMLKASLYSPEKFKELKFLISALSKDNVIPENFKKLYNTFMEVFD